MTTLPFHKYHGLGNDFVLIDDLDAQYASVITPPLVRAMCDRRFGVGADQLLWIRKPTAEKADARMTIFNPDGTTAEMCGNGIRCVARYLYDRRKLKTAAPGAYVIETLCGLKRVELGKKGGTVRVDMGPPVLGGGFREGGESLPGKTFPDGEPLRFFEVNMGNPHAVLFVPAVDGIPVEELGAWIEKAPRFPKRTNVEFVEVTAPRTIRVRVWERGAGATLACGTGACASAVAALALGRVRGPLAVDLPGGSLTIEWAGAEKPVLMEGPGVEVFSGQFVYSPFASPLREDRIC